VQREKPKEKEDLPDALMMVPTKEQKNVLDIVQQEDIPVTFFIVGEHVFASVSQTGYGIV
jgi:hypothetical protein